MSESSPTITLDIPEIARNLVLPATTVELAQAQRLFHGRGHAYENLNHISIDWLPPVILITLFAPVTTSDLVTLSVMLNKYLPSCESIQVQHRDQKSWPVGTLYGETISNLEILESTLRYKLHLGEGRNTGLFLDMKNGRDWVRQHCRGNRVLNLFAYTCGFSVAAIAGGAKSVYNTDISSPVLSTGRNNHRLNNHSLEAVKFEKLNILKSFGRIIKQGPFDLLICDPPTFQKGSIDLMRDYPKIMRKLDAFMAVDSTLMLCINSPNIGKQTGREFLIQTMQENAPQFDLVDEIKPPRVYIDSQGKGTKTLIFRRKV